MVTNPHPRDVHGLGQSTLHKQPMQLSASLRSWLPSGGKLHHAGEVTMACLSAATVISHSHSSHTSPMITYTAPDSTYASPSANEQLGQQTGSGYIGLPDGLSFVQVAGLPFNFRGNMESSELQQEPSCPPIAWHLSQQWGEGERPSPYLGSKLPDPSGLSGYIPTDASRAAGSNGSELPCILPTRHGPEMIDLVSDGADSCDGGGGGGGGGCCRGGDGGCCCGGGGGGGYCGGGCGGGCCGGGNGGHPCRGSTLTRSGGAVDMRCGSVPQQTCNIHASEPIVEARPITGYTPWHHSPARVVVEELYEENARSGCAVSKLPVQAVGTAAGTSYQYTEMPVQAAGTAAGTSYQYTEMPVYTVHGETHNELGGLRRLSRDTPKDAVHSAYQTDWFTHPESKFPPVAPQHSTQAELASAIDPQSDGGNMRQRSYRIARRQQTHTKPPDAPDPGSSNKSYTFSMRQYVSELTLPIAEALGISSHLYNSDAANLNKSAARVRAGGEERRRRKTRPGSGPTKYGAVRVKDNADIPGQCCSLPDGSLPDGSLPGGSLPGGLSAGGQLAGSSLSSGLLPSGLLPGGLLPGGSLPGGLLPVGQLACGLLAGGSLPAGSLPAGPTEQCEGGSSNRGSFVIQPGSALALTVRRGHFQGAAASAGPRQRTAPRKTTEFVRLVHGHSALLRWISGCGAPPPELCLPTAKPKGSSMKQDAGGRRTQQPQQQPQQQRGPQQEPQRWKNVTKTATTAAKSSGRKPKFLKGITATTATTTATATARSSGRKPKFPEGMPMRSRSSKKMLDKAKHGHNNKLAASRHTSLPNRGAVSKPAASRHTALPNRGAVPKPEQHLSAWGCLAMGGEDFAEPGDEIPNDDDDEYIFPGALLDSKCARSLTEPRRTDRQSRGIRSQLQGSPSIQTLPVLLSSHLSSSPPSHHQSSPVKPRSHHERESDMHSKSELLASVTSTKRRPSASSDAMVDEAYERSGLEAPRDLSGEGRQVGSGVDGAEWVLEEGEPVRSCAKRKYNEKYPQARPRSFRSEPKENCPQAKPRSFRPEAKEMSPRARPRNAWPECKDNYPQARPRNSWPVSEDNYPQAGPPNASPESQEMRPQAPQARPRNAWPESQEMRPQAPQARPRNAWPESQEMRLQAPQARPRNAWPEPQEMRPQAPQVRPRNAWPDSQEMRPQALQARPRNAWPEPQEMRPQARPQVRPRNAWPEPNEVRLQAPQARPRNAWPDPKENDPQARPRNARPVSKEDYPQARPQARPRNAWPEPEEPYPQARPRDYRPESLCGSFGLQLKHTPSSQCILHQVEGHLGCPVPGACAAGAGSGLVPAVAQGSSGNGLRHRAAGDHNLGINPGLVSNYLACHLLGNPDFRQQTAHPPLQPTAKTTGQVDCRPQSHAQQPLAHQPRTHAHAHAQQPHAHAHQPHAHAHARTQQPHAHAHAHDQQPHAHAQQTQAHAYAQQSHAHAHAHAHAQQSHAHAHAQQTQAHAHAQQSHAHAHAHAMPKLAYDADVAPPHRNGADVAPPHHNGADVAPSHRSIWTKGMESEELPLELGMESQELPPPHPILWRKGVKSQEHLKPLGPTHHPLTSKVNRTPLPLPHPQSPPTHHSPSSPLSLESEDTPMTKAVLAPELGHSPEPSVGQAVVALVSSHSPDSSIRQAVMAPELGHSPAPSVGQAVVPPVSSHSPEPSVGQAVGQAVVAPVLRHTPGPRVGHKRKGGAQDRMEVHQLCKKSSPIYLAKEWPIMETARASTSVQNTASRKRIQRYRWVSEFYAEGEVMRCSEKVDYKNLEGF